MPRNLRGVTTSLSPPLRCAKNTQHNTSKVLRVPRKMNMDTSKVLRLPRKIQLMFREPRKSTALVTQNDFRILSTLSHTQCGRCMEMLCRREKLNLAAVLWEKPFTGAFGKNFNKSQKCQKKKKHTLSHCILLENKYIRIRQRTIVGFTFFLYIYIIIYVDYIYIYYIHNYICRFYI